MMVSSSATENPSAVRRTTLPFFGVASIVAGAIMPAWAIVGSIAGGPEAGGWVPLILLIGFPSNVVALALFVVAVVCGIHAVRRAGADRVLGVIGLILAGLQLLAAAVLAWAFAGAIFAG